MNIYSVTAIEEPVDGFDRSEQNMISAIIASDSEQEALVAFFKEWSKHSSDTYIDNGNIRVDRISDEVLDLIVEVREMAKKEEAFVRAFVHKSFYEWAQEQASRPDVVGILTAGIKVDPDWPASGTLQECKDYLSSLGVSNVTLEALEEAWREYKGEVA